MNKIRFPNHRQKPSHAMLIENGDCEAMTEIPFGSEDDIFVNEYGSGREIAKYLAWVVMRPHAVMTQRD